MKNNFFDRKLLIVQYFIMILIITSYLTNRYISLLAAVAGFLYILFDKEEHNSIALLLFLLPFSSIFTISDGTTSLFMLLRIACIIKLLYRFRIPKRYFIWLMIFALYSVLSMVLGGTAGIVRIINLILWFLIGLSIILFYKAELIQVWARSLAQGTIFSCIVACNLNLIPNLKNTLAVATYLSTESETIVSRFSGLWNDPNGLTVFIIVSMFVCFLALNANQINIIEFYVYVIVLTVFGIMTLSKSCMILMVIFWGYVFFSKSQLRLSYKILIIIIGVISLYAINNTMAETVTELIARFTSSSSSAKLTSGRTDLWKMYFDNMDSLIWIFGKGINANLPNGRAAHNTLIQVIYNVGIIGFFLWGRLFVEQILITRGKNFHKIVLVPILSIFATMFFLDGMFLELFYILIPVLVCTSLTPGIMDKNPKLEK